ncbi:MAG: TonB-dependent receptor plug domain-containing protein [Hyphomicrobiaceae bacterium]
MHCVFLKSRRRRNLVLSLSKDGPRTTIPASTSSARRWSSFAVFGVMPLLCAPALAQQPTELPPIVVQGATLAPPPSRPASAPAQPAATAPAASDTQASSETVGGVPAYTIGNAISIVTGQQLREQQVRNGAEALRGLPGVEVSRSGGFGNFTQVRIRGAEGNQTLVLIDGIEANNLSDGEFDFSNLSAEDIERIEVIRGPMSGLYGSNAVGGVINIITRAGKGPPSATVRTEVGSFGTRDVAARVAGGSDRAHLAVSYHWRETDGFNIAPVGGEDDGSRFGTLLVRGGARLLPGVTLDFTVRRSDKRADRDGFGNVFDPALNGTLAAAFDDLSTLRDRILLAGANLRWDAGNLTQELRTSHNGTITEDWDRSFSSTSKNVSDTDRLSYLATYRFDTPGLWAKHTVSGRVEKEMERFSSHFADTFPPDDDKTNERGRVSYTGEWRGAFHDRLFLTAGIRRDDNDNFQDFTTWRTAASLLLPEINARPHASAGTAVKLPTMFEQFGLTQFFVPNPNLTPEESFGWDAGVEFTFHKRRVIFDVTYFHSNLTNKINGFFFDPVIGNFTAINLAGESTREGVEISARYKVAPNLTLGGAYTYLDARDPNGAREMRRPPHAARSDVTYTFHGGRGTATLAAIYNGRMEDRAFELPFFSPTSIVALDPYWLVNATASYKVQRGVEVFGRVENLLDQRYQEVFGFESAPIAAYAGAKLTFGGPDGIGGDRIPLK